MFEQILAAIFIFIAGGLIGAAIALWYLNKSVDELMDSYKNLTSTYDNILELDDRMINALTNRLNAEKKLTRCVYSDLVRLRDIGTENLDELIGYLGEALNCHEEETA